MNMCTGFATDVIWVRTKVCSITREQTQSSDRYVLCFKDSPELALCLWCKKFLSERKMLKAIEPELSL